jgi:hypothetical protein
MRYSGHVLAGLIVLALTIPAKAGMIAADALPLPNRVATADMVILGKVTAIEAQPAAVAPFPGAKNKMEFKVAVITVSDALKAPMGIKTIRLGYTMIPPGVMINPPPFQAAVGQEGCFFLTKHPVADFPVAYSPLNFLNKKNPNFAKDMDLVRRCVKILADPDAVLKSKIGKEDGFLAAAMLIAQYYARRSPNAKLEPIDAEQSRRILLALGGADWTPTKDFTQLSPRMVLSRLPLTVKDDWAPPQDPAAYAVYAQKWVNDHANTYRLQRYAIVKNKE